MMRYAVVDNGNVINIVEWDGVTEWKPNSGYPIQINDDVGIGWSYENNVFTAPPSEKNTPEQNLINARTQCDLASLKISEFRDMIDDNDFSQMTSDEVNAELASWTEYRKALRKYIADGDGSADFPLK
ncbi:hypothetical protein V4836_06960 [Kluyvera ascorbata]|uniref:Tail fiber assembly protein n=1 Tax=Kluyvera ascorbata TaxID=51288 RepID=A0AB35X2X3_9ENTR